MNQESNAKPTWSKLHRTCFWPDVAPVHPSLSTLLDFFVYPSNCHVIILCDVGGGVPLA